MPPQQHNQPTGPPGLPQPSITPHAPHFDYAATPVQHPNGQYETLPPPPVSNNTGHSGHNPYEFIVNPSKPKRASRFSNLGGASSLKGIGVILGAIVVIVIIAVVILSALAPKGSTPGLIAIAERQQEIIRISDAAGTQATGEDTQNFVANVNVSLISSQQQLVGYLTAHGTKLKAKGLALDQDSQTDSLLASAATANNYDPAVTENLTQQLQTYENLLQTTYKQTSNKQTQALLQGCFNSASLLLKQAKLVAAE